MKIIRNFPIVSDTPLVMTIGNFDGVHLGHQYLIEQVCRQAAALSPPLQAAVMTFEPHPLAILRPQQPLARLGGCSDKARLLRQCGLDVLYMPRFNQKLAALSAEAFADLLFSKLQVRHLIVGENFRFGNGGRGDFALLQKAAANAGANAIAAPLLSVDAAPVSSGRVRNCLQQGDFATAAKLLGREWCLQGRVRHGSARGRKWGFPTANIALSYNPPLRGIFAGRAEVNGNHYAAAVSIGVNPTVNSGSTVRVEAYLLDFSGEIYGARLRLQLLKKLRDEQKYDSIAALTAAITNDVESTRLLAG